MTPRKIFLASTILVVTSQASLAGGSPGYHPPPYYAEQPPVIVTPPLPNPLAALGVGIGALVGGALAIPGIVLGGLFGAIAPPVAVLCIPPDGSLFPCAGPTPGPGCGPQTPFPPPPDQPRPSRAPSGPPQRHSGGQPCYDGQGRFIGGNNRECAN